MVRPSVRALIAACCLALALLVPPACGQTGTWVAHEEEWSDYLVIREDVLLVLRIDDRGACLGAPLPLAIVGDTLRRQGAANWTVDVVRGRPDTLHVTMPDTTRVFERTLHDPIAQCTTTDEI